MTTVPATLTRVHWHHPEWVAVLVAVGGWTALAAPVATAPALLVRGGHPSGAAVIGHAAAMAAAMMGPLVLPHLHDLAGSSLWPRRYRAVAGYLAGYLGLWTVAGAVMMTVLHTARPTTGALPLATALGALAVAVAGSPAHRRRLRRCAATRPLALTGWRADRDCLDAGLRMGWRCLATTWAVMLAVMAQGGVLVLAAGTAYLVAERGGRVPDRRLTRWTLVVVLLAVLITAAGLLPSASGGPPEGPHARH